MTRTIADYATRETPEWRKVHGKCVYASRLCKQGKFEEAKAYLARFGIPFPPFSEDPVKTAERLAKEAAGSNVQGEAAHAAEEAAKTEAIVLPGPAASVEPTSNTVTLQCSQDLSVGAAAPEGQQQAEAGTKPNVGYAPTEPHSLKAKIIGFCPNPRVIAIQLENGERASMWSGGRRVYRQYEEVAVELDRGVPGKNAIYREKVGRL